LTKNSKRKVGQKSLLRHDLKKPDTPRYYLTQKAWHNTAKVVRIAQNTVMPLVPGVMFFGMPEF
jgi:hypothetical protein